MVPDGPLHPIDAVLALGTGFAVAAIAARHPRRWTALVLAAFVGVVSQRHGVAIWRGFLDRPSPVVPIVATVAVVTMATWATTRRSPPTMRAVVPVVGSLAVVWALIPDTETPLIAGCVVVGAASGLASGVRSRRAGLLVLLPAASAVIGTAGRPDVLGVAGSAAALVGGSIYVVMTVISRSTRWAGTPTTVVPAATTSRTTDPAPIVAS